MLRIGVSACFMYPDPNRLVFGHKTLTYIEKDMSRFLSRPDVQAIMIPDLEGDTMAAFLEGMDALVLQGGADLAPESYGEEPIEDGRWRGDSYRDEYEFTLIDYFMKRGKPILGICRGFQVLNVYFGGTLYQDIATQRPNSIKHRDAAQYDQISHDIEFMPDGLMQEIYGQGASRRVNSIHHQGVKDIGKDLQILAKCKEDGMIEAFTWTGAEPGKVMGVQWHPEFAYNFKPGGLLEAPKLYDHFLAICRKVQG
jgi:putative glutamine amidotransferase